MVRSTRNVMKWPATCGVPSTDLVFPSPPHSPLLLHPSPSHTHTYTIFIFLGHYPTSLIAAKTTWAGGQGWMDKHLPLPIPLLCVVGKLFFFGFVLFFLNKKDSTNKVLCGFSLGVRVEAGHWDLAPLSWLGFRNGRGGSATKSRDLSLPPCLGLSTYRSPMWPSCPAFHSGISSPRSSVCYVNWWIME